MKTRLILLTVLLVLTAAVVCVSILLAPPAQVVEPVADAVKAALAAATPRSLVYMGGSAFLVADVLRTAKDLE